MRHLWTLINVAVFVVLLTAFWGLQAPPVASATTNSLVISLGATPTEDVPLDIGVSGSTVTSTYLWVYVGSSGGCASTPYVEEEQAYSTLTYGSYLSSPGSFSEHYSFTPANDTSSYIVCTYLDDYGSDTPATTTSQTFMAQAPSASLTLTLPSNATQDEPANITVSGSTETSQYLWAYIDTDASDSCAATPYEEEDIAYSTLADGSYETAGNFSQDFSFTPPTTSATYLVCSYIDDDESDAPFASQEATFSAAAPSASVSVSASGTPTAGQKVTLTISGTTEIDDYLFAYLSNQSAPCGATPFADGTDDTYETLADGNYITSGSFSKSLSFTPENAGTYILCAYVDDDEFDAPYASGSTTLSVGIPAASVGVASIGTQTIGGNSTISVTGSASEEETLQVKVCDPSGACDDVASDDSEDGEDPTVNGQFSSSLTYTPNFFGSYTVTAQVLYENEGGSSSVSASSSTSFSVDGATQTGPAADTIGTMINPRFTWSGTANEVFAVELGKVHGSSVNPFAQLQQGGWANLPASTTSATGLLSGSIKKLSGAATFSVANGSGSMHLDQALPPGTYAWRLITSGPSGDSDDSVITSSWSDFTVLGPKLTRLTAAAQSTREDSYKYPGYTTLNIVAVPYSKVRIKFTTGGRTTTLTQQWSDQSTGSQRINWTCAKAGNGTLRYVITASDSHGDKKTVHGDAQYVSSQECAMLQAQMIAAEQAANLAEQRAQQQAAAEALAEQQAAYERFVNNCKALGGTPVVLELSSGSSTYCRAPYGGYLDVPTN